jgi:hypothetical protein
MLNSKRNAYRHGVRVCHRDCIGEGTVRNKVIRKREKNEWKNYER